MTREEFTAFINFLENKYPVNQWVIDDIHLWPLIKIKLSFAFHSNSKPEVQDSNTDSATSKLKKALLGLFQLVKIFLKKKSTTQAKLFCLAPHFRYYDGDQYVNRYFNQLIAQSKKEEHDFLMGEYANTKKEYRENLDFPEQTIYFENLKYLSLFLREFTWKKYAKNVDWPEFEGFLAEVEQSLDGKALTKNAILKQFVYIKTLKSFYKKILEKNAINEAYILCYYVSEMYAMNLAAAELNIATWDMQHGGQGSLHIAYTNFNVIPETGYKLLPRKFWVWDTASALEIDKWIDHQEFHKVEVKGNPWIEYCIHRYNNEIDTSKKIILYTMQPVGDNLLDNYIVEAIKNTPPDYIWWLRLHPRQLKEKIKLKKLLENHNLLDRVNIEDATTLPLPGILSKAYIHLSKFSGSILEANIMKVKTIILSEIGVESFPEVVNTEYGLIHLEKDSKVLLQQIINLNNKVW